LGAASRRCERSHRSGTGRRRWRKRCVRSLAALVPSCPRALVPSCHCRHPRAAAAAAAVQRSLLCRGGVGAGALPQGLWVAGERVGAAAEKGAASSPKKGKKGRKQRRGEKGEADAEASARANLRPIKVKAALPWVKRRGLSLVRAWGGGGGGGGARVERCSVIAGPMRPLSEMHSSTPGLAAAALSGCCGALWPWGWCGCRWRSWPARRPAARARTCAR
jgi:hypothetical protein